MKIRTMFKWMLGNKSVHNFLGHAHHAIQANGGRGLFHRSERPLEVLLLDFQFLTLVMEISKLLLTGSNNQFQNYKLYFRPKTI